MDGNPYGDLELTDPQAMRALAHPVRLAILDRLRRHGPATATELSPFVGATATVTSWHLRHLGGFGFVRDSAPGPDRRARRWEVVSRGFRFAIPADPTDTDGTAAARVLSQHLFDRAASAPAEWARDVEPGLDQQWRRAAGLSDTRVTVTAGELEQIDSAIEAVLAPFVRRDPGDGPVTARGVRLLRYVLPEAGEGSPPDPTDPTDPVDQGAPESR